MFLTLLILLKLEDPADVLSDDMGAWSHNGVDTAYLNFLVTSDRVLVEKNRRGSFR